MGEFFQIIADWKMRYLKTKTKHFMAQMLVFIVKNKISTARVFLKDRFRAKKLTLKIYRL